MNNTALFFPGQASQYVGMGKDLHDYSADVRLLYEMASDEMGIDIARLSFEGPAEELKRTANTQPAILLHSLAVLTILREELPSFSFAAGHSLGEYGALAAAGALSNENAVRAVIKRAALMEQACIQNPGTMAAIIGLGNEQVEEVCRKASMSGIVVAANYNAASQVVISGTNAGVEAGIAFAKEAGAKRALKLEVGGAFHSPLMQPAVESLAAYLEGLKIDQAVRPVIANVTGRPVSEPTEIRQLLSQQVTAPVRWAQTMSYLAGTGVRSVIEIGPGKVLAGMARREMNLEQTINLDTLADVKAFTSVGSR
ncbi:MAG: ACP S-malonyltransferase [Candidatus Zixiibacteriota bacterium]